VISFFVGGQPISQGSMKVMNGRVIHSAGSALAAWRSAIALEAKRAGAKPSINPIGMELIFVFQKPKTVTCYKVKTSRIFTATTCPAGWKK
jgi:hypothetical protein